MKVIFQISWWRQGDISNNRISCCWGMMMMRLYTNVVRSKSTDMIYAHDLVYKVLLRSSRGACGIMLSCIFETSWWWISAGSGCDCLFDVLPEAAGWCAINGDCCRGMGDGVDECCTWLKIWIPRRRRKARKIFLSPPLPAAFKFERHFYGTVYLAGILVNLVVDAEDTLLLYNADGVILLRLLKVVDFWLCNPKPADLVALYSFSCEFMYLLL